MYFFPTEYFKCLEGGSHSESTTLQTIGEALSSSSGSNVLLFLLAFAAILFLFLSLILTIYIIVHKCKKGSTIPIQETSKPLIMSSINVPRTLTTSFAHNINDSELPLLQNPTSVPSSQQSSLLRDPHRSATYAVVEQDSQPHCPSPMASWIETSREANLTLYVSVVINGRIITSLNHGYPVIVH